MTIPAGQSSITVSLGNGVATVFPYNFKITAEADLLVYTIDLSDAEVTLALGVDYTVSGVGNNSGGDITLLGGALTNLWEIACEDNVAVSQTTPFTTQGAFFAVLHENAFDKLTRLVKRVSDSIANSFRLPLSVTGIDLTLPVPSALKGVRWNNAETAFEETAIIASLLTTGAITAADNGDGTWTLTVTGTGGDVLAAGNNIFSGTNDFQDDTSTYAYDNSISGLEADELSDAVDELAVIANYDWTDIIFTSIPTLSVPTTGFPALCYLGAHGGDRRIAFFDDNNGFLRTFKLSGTAFTATGSSLAIATAGKGALAFLSSNDTTAEVAFIDATNEDLRMYQYTFSSGNWAEINTELNIGSIDSPSLAALSATSVALLDSNTEELRTYDHNGTTWALTGSGLNLNTDATGMAALSVTRVAVADTAANTLKAYDWSGTAWTLVGSGLTIASMGTNVAMTALNSTDVAIIDTVNEVIQTYRFNGTTWAINGRSIERVGVTGSALTTVGTDEIVHIDNATNVLLNLQCKNTLGDVSHALDLL